MTPLKDFYPTAVWAPVARALDRLGFSEESRITCQWGALPPRDILNTLANIFAATIGATTRHGIPLALKRYRRKLTASLDTLRKTNETLRDPAIAEVDANHRREIDATKSTVKQLTATEPDIDKYIDALQRWFDLEGRVGNADGPVVAFLVAAVRPVLGARTPTPAAMRQRLERLRKVYNSEGKQD